MTVILNRNEHEMAQSKIKYGESCYYLTLDFSSFSGKKTAKDSEVFSLNGINVSSVTESPRKKLVDSKNISFVQKHYMRAKRVFDDIGVPIWGGWLVPKHSIDELKFEFLTIKKSYDIESQNFVAAYRTLLEQQCAEYPDIADFIRNDAPDSNVVRSKFYMRLSPMLAISLRDDDEIEEIGSAISYGLFAQFKKLAESTLQCLTKQETVRIATIRKNLEQIKEKANTFAFTDSIWDGTVGLVDAIIKRLPLEGSKLETNEKAMLMLALGMFTDEKRLKIAANDINNLDLESILMPKVAVAVDEDDDLIMCLTQMRSNDE
ncbi:hypothetical protein H5185_08665, partial [Shewanella sp. SG44-6]|uniref:DUF3150 domain-containing protein n=1 Tax=Shewanella sp. SG44-6 TaxID=2760959 RepID=UPI0016030358